MNPSDIAVGDLVHIRWLDSGYALGDGDWQHVVDMEEELEGEAMMAETVGYYLGYVKHEVVAVAQTRDIHNDAWLNAHAVWVPAIQSIQRLHAPS